MSTTIAEARPAPRRVERVHASADAAVARHAFQQVRTSALVCAIAFGGTAAASALAYVSSFPTAASRHQLAVTTGGDTGLAVLLGPVSAIDTVGGYTVYQGFVFLTTIAAVWAVLAATRLLRGEEDAGRWQLLLSGSTRASRVTAASLVALAAAVGLIFAGTSLLTLLAGRNPDVAFGVTGSLLYGLSIASPAAVFGAIGAVTSQLGRTRRAASALGITVLAIASVVRMIADSGATAHWLRWATPFGWAELMRPLTDSDPWPAVPAAATALVLAAVAIVLSGGATWAPGFSRRGTSFAPGRSGSAPSSASPPGSSYRCSRPGRPGSRRRGSRSVWSPG